MLRQYTATVYIVHEGKVLLLFHKKHNVWMPPGGHVELNETPCEAARREVFEETGLEIEFIGQENVWFEGLPNAKSIQRPHHVLLETIPQTTQEPAHEHIDFCFVARPLAQAESHEEQILRWFDHDSILNLTPGKDIFLEVRSTIIHLLQTVVTPI